MAGNGGSGAGYLSIAVGDTSAQTTAVPRRQARAAGIENASGAMITAFEPHGPAALAGLMSLDTIVQLNGLPITGIDDLIRNLNGERINRVTMIEVLRRGQLCSSTSNRWSGLHPLQRQARGRPRLLFLFRLRRALRAGGS
jgi:hypothetical protein